MADPPRTAMTARRAWRLRLTIEPSVVREIPRFVPVVVGGNRAFWRSARLLRVKPGLPPWGQCPLPPSAISARCRLPRQDFTRGEACRFAYRAADQVRVGDQPQDGESAGPRSAGLAARPRRRGDRMMKRREFITLLGDAATYASSSPICQARQKCSTKRSIARAGARRISSRT